MKKIILSLLIASIMLLFGCGKESVENSISQNNYNPFSNYEKESNEQVDAMFGYGLVDPAVDGKIKYNKDMSLDFWIENAGNDNDFGFMIYIDGVRQDISVDEVKSQMCTLLMFLQVKEKLLMLSLNQMSLSIVTRFL